MWDSQQDRIFLLSTSSLCFMDWFLLPPGDFMTDMQQRMKQEEERLAKLDPWKVMQNVVCDDQLFVWRKGFFILNC